MDDQKLVTQINKFVRKLKNQGWSAEALKEYKFEVLEQANAKPKQKAQSQQKAAAVAAEGNTRRAPPPPPPPADSIAAKEKEENTEWCPPCPPPAELPPGKEVSVLETTSRQPREVPTTSEQDDPELPPFKRFKGSGVNGSNGIPLVDGGASPDLLKNPNTTQNIIPTPLPAYSKKDVWDWFSDGTFTRPPDGFWKGGRLTWGQHVVWDGLTWGKNGGESAKTLLYHGVVCGPADSEAVYVK